MARRPVNTWDEYIVVGNTGGEGGHDITQKNPNYIPGGVAPGQKSTAAPTSQWKSYYTNIIKTQAKGQAQTKRDRKNINYWKRKMGTGEPQWASKQERSAFFDSLTKYTEGAAITAVKQQAHSQWTTDKIASGYMDYAAKEAFRANTQGFRAAYTPGVHKRTSNTGGEGGHEDVTYDYGFKGMHQNQLRELATTLTYKAQERWDKDLTLISKGTQERKERAYFQARGVKFTGKVDPDELSAAHVRAGIAPSGDIKVNEVAVGGARRTTLATGTTGLGSRPAVKKKSVLSG